MGDITQLTGLLLKRQIPLGGLVWVYEDVQLPIPPPVAVTCLKQVGAPVTYT